MINSPVVSQESRRLSSAQDGTAPGESLQNQRLTPAPTSYPATRQISQNLAVAASATEAQMLSEIAIAAKTAGEADYDAKSRNVGLVKQRVKDLLKDRRYAAVLEARHKNGTLSNFTAQLTRTYLESYKTGYAKDAAWYEKSWDNLKDFTADFTSVASMVAEQAVKIDSQANKALPEVMTCGRAAGLIS